MIDFRDHVEGAAGSRHSMTDNLEGRVPWNARDALSGVAVVWLSTLFTVGLVSSIESGESSATEVVTTIALLLNGVFIVVIWLLAIRKHRASWADLGLARSKVRLGILLALPAVGLSLVFGGAYSLLLMELGADDLLPPELPEAALGEGVYRLTNIVSIGLVAPFVEEMFFRGFVLAALLQVMGRISAVVVGSLLFAVSHLVVTAMLPVFVTGLILSCLYIKTRSIWPPFAAHAAQNLLVVSLRL